MDGGSASLDPLWSTVVLALHFDGSNGATTIVDQKGHTSPSTNRGSSAISTARSMFGGSSLLLANNGGLTYSTGAVNTDFLMPGDFLYRGWLWVDSAADGTNRILFDSRTGPSDGSGFLFYLNVNTGWTFYTGTTFWFNDSGGTSFPVPRNQWIHVALCRAGSNLRLFVNGILLITATVTANFTSGRCILFDANREYNAALSFVGNVDDFELAIGTGSGIYTASFVPPNAPFPNS